jgi:hypothetical protein
LLKSFNTGRFSPLRKITFVIREKQWYDPTGIGVWWKKRLGVGIAGEPGKGFKYLMVGLDILNIKVWLDFTWIGKMDPQPLSMQDTTNGEITIK